MSDKIHARQIIAELVEKYSTQIDTFQNIEYNETQTRLDFINPFFEALGWDMDNKNQKKESERDVKQEFSVPKDGQNKKVDYAFLNHKKVVFFLEAKKPSVLLKHNAIAAYQIRSYAWNKSLPISLMTNFAEFTIYDGTKKIREGETAASKRIKYLTFKDYIKEFDFLWETFAYENIVKGSLEKYIETRIDLKNTEPVDAVFLASLNKWRHELAQNILKNQEIDEESLNEVVQKNIDKIVFLRVCEDRNIETKGRLKEISERKGKTFAYLYDYFREADQKYNSGLFNFKNDQLSQNLKIDNATIKEIIKDLEKSDYKFDIIPIEILGYAYEQFLGKVIRLDERNLIIEEKPEVRKAGGVYYTPDYIVNYIVENTLGKLIADKTPEEVAHIKVLDPSCGSGSFLLGAYEYLLNWHLDFYKQNKATKKYSLKENPLSDENQLTIQEKKRILVNNIFGVDIDNQAVEVSKLSLLLKALENETEFTVKTSLVLFKERALPNIDNNILCGNSLIENDFYDNGLFLTPKEERKINAFDWKNAFPTIFEQGGFDCIIGNPPYVNIENLENYAKNYYFEHYQTCKGRTDIYIAFIEKALKNMNKNGILSIIIPYAFTNQVYGTALRELLIKKHFVREIVDMSNFFVFDQAVVKNIILSVEKNISQEKTKILISDSKTNFLGRDFKKMYVSQHDFLTLKDFRFETKPVFDKLPIKEKIWKKSVVLEKICLVAYGARLNHKTEKIGKEAYIFEKAKKGFKPFLEGKNIERYYFSQKAWLNYQPDEHYNSMFLELFDNEKIMFINIVKDRLRFAYDNQGFYNSHTVINCVRIDKLQGAKHISARKIVENTDIEFCKNYDYKFLLGVLNSKLINWYFVNFLSEQLHFYPNDAKNLPIPQLNFEDKTQKAQHEQLIKLVEAMLELNKRANEKTSQSQNDQIKRRIQYLDQEIDNLVYQLYGLEASEIALIENENA